MKKCIECGRNNGKVRMVFVGARCEDCVEGRVVVKEVMVREKAEEEVGMIEVCRCGVVLYDGNRYIYENGRKDCRCIDCAREYNRMRYYVNKTKINGN